MSELFFKVGDSVKEPAAELFKFSFSEALHQLKEGKQVARSGWNGKGMWLFLITSYEVAGWHMYPHLPFIIMKTADDKIVPWLASQTDILASDWETVK